MVWRYTTSSSLKRICRRPSTKAHMRRSDSWSKRSIQRWISCRPRTVGVQRAPVRIEAGTTRVCVKTRMSRQIIRAHWWGEFACNGTSNLEVRSGSPSSCSISWFILVWQIRTTGRSWWGWWAFKEILQMQQTITSLRAPLCTRALGCSMENPKSAYRCAKNQESWWRLSAQWSMEKNLGSRRRRYTIHRPRTKYAKSEKR